MFKRCAIGLCLLLSACGGVWQTHQVKPVIDHGIVITHHNEKTMLRVNSDRLFVPMTTQWATQSEVTLSYLARFVESLSPLSATVVAINDRNLTAKMRQKISSDQAQKIAHALIERGVTNRPIIATTALNRPSQKSLSNRQIEVILSAPTNGMGVK